MIEELDLKEGYSMNYYAQETERSRLRQMNPSDLAAWTAFFVNNPLEIYLGIDVSLPAESKARNWIELQQGRYRTNNYGHLAAIDKSSGQMIGVGGLIERRVHEKQELEIAYSIIPKYWGEGFATEIARELKAFAFLHGLSDSLISIIHEANEGSKKVALKNGMQKTSTDIFNGMNVEIFRVDHRQKTK